MKVRELSKEEFDNFAKQDDFANPWQTSNYAEAAQALGYNTLFLGIEDNGALKGCTLILTKSVYLGQSVSYAPRGIITDYGNLPLVNAMLSSLKSYLSDRKIMSFTMDPLIVMEVRDRHGVIKGENYSGVDKRIDDTVHNGEIIKSQEYAKEFRKAIMRKNKYEYRGENYYFEGIQPRWYSEIKLPIITKSFLHEIDKRSRNKLRKATKLGVEIIKDDTKNVENFYEIAKDNFKRPMNYYKALLENNPDAELYLAKINTEKYVNNSKIIYERELDRNDSFARIIEERNLRGKSIQKILNKKLESDHMIAGYKEHLLSATNLLKTKPDGFFIAYAIVIKSNKHIYIFEDGFSSEFKHIPALQLMRFKLLDQYSDSQYETYNFGAITGNFDRKINDLYGLNIARLYLGGSAVEYIGEFGLMTNKPMYSLYQTSVINRFKFKV